MWSGEERGVLWILLFLIKRPCVGGSEPGEATSALYHLIL